MSNDQQARLGKALVGLSALYPNWRIGQIVANIASWARGPTAEAIWEIEDEEFLAAAEAHLARRQNATSSDACRGATLVR